MARVEPTGGSGDPRVATGRVPTKAPLDQRFDQGALYVLRAAVAAHAGALGADEDVTVQVLIIAGELAANAIRHGGGHGRLRLWAADGYLTCEVSDSGGGLTDPHAAGTREPSPAALGGRGLWIVRQIAARVTVDSGPHGTTIAASVAVPVPGGD
jgi:anti-sigma regulatory factor (Ser/Thr protein kinase)